MLVESSGDTLAMIVAACERLGERALICGGVNEFDGVPDGGRVKFVPAVSYSAIFPSCRAVVHHGNCGATAAGLRAGLPTLALWKIPDQLIWGNAISQLKVGTARCFFSTTEDSLVSDLRRILSPEYSTRAREISTMMAKPADSASDAADLVESLASGWSEL
jgi:UDP:flavonoid glycosyltransferase YjiC (YdhE family)